MSHRKAPSELRVMRDLCERSEIGKPLNPNEMLVGAGELSKMCNRSIVFSILKLFSAMLVNVLNIYINIQNISIGSQGKNVPR